MPIALVNEVTWDTSEGGKPSANKRGIIVDEHVRFPSIRSLTLLSSLRPRRANANAKCSAFSGGREIKDPRARALESKKKTVAPCCSYFFSPDKNTRPVRSTCTTSRYRKSIPISAEKFEGTSELTKNNAFYFLKNKRERKKIQRQFSNKGSVPIPRTKYRTLILPTGIKRKQ